nr:succinylglutamate desuccinylase/aspartoacylase family protein [Bacteroidota bacterium]
MIINLFIIPLPAQEGWREKEMEVKVMLRDRHDADKLNSLKLNGDIYTNFATMYVTPQELEKIRISELNYVIQIENLNNYFRDFWENRDAYHTYEEIIALMDSLAETLPGICMKTVYGESLGGRELSAIKISDNVQLDENEPEMAFDGNIHGDEIGGGENTIRFARYLCQQYGENPEITELVNNREIWIFPLVNPDGRVNMTRYNNNGVDLNRDWGYLWDATGGSPGAYSQPESKALRQMVYENQFNIHMTFHSGIEMFLHPWYFREEPCPDNAQELELADVYAGNSGYSNLTTGPGTSLYPTNGSTAEALYGVMGSHGIVMELSSDKQPPASQLGYYFGINLEPMIKMIEYAGYGIEGTITDAETSDPVAAAVFIGNTLPCYSDPEVGDFHKFIMPGTYSIIVRANGYQTKLVENIGVVYNDVTIADIELEPEAHQSIYRIDATRIPGGNMADEGTTWYAIGPPDNMNYSLGQNGWIVFDMQELVVDGEGDDIIVFEGDASPEGFTLYAGPTMDGPWSMVGSGNGTTEFDLAESTQSEARFFKIQDDNSGPGGDNAGFDLDAVQALSFISGVYILLDEVVIDDASGNNNGLLDAGETAIFNTYLKNIGTEDATNIFGTLTCSDEYIEIFTTTPQEFGNILVGESAWATFTVHAGEMTPFGHSSMFTLGYTGDNNLSGSKIFEISFQDYCEASTNTEDEYIANVLFG